MQTTQQPRQLYQADVKTPDEPRVRYFKKRDVPLTPPPPGHSGKALLEDITAKIVKLAVREGGQDGKLILQRLDADGKVLWETQHSTIKELMWDASFEFGLSENKWQAVKK